MNGLPQLGAGVSYRPRWRRDVVAGRDCLGCLEIIADDYLEANADKLLELTELADAFTLLPHAVGTSLGTDAPLDGTRLRKTAQLLERVSSGPCGQPPWFSEHLAFTHADGVSFGHLAALPFTMEAVTVVCRNVRHWRDAVRMPLLLENITYMVALPGQLTEAQFLCEVLERTGCGLLLDLHNVYTNATNHDYDACEFIESLPLDRVAQIHLGGGHEEDDGYPQDGSRHRIDSHNSATPEPVWDLLRFVAERTTINAVIVEWDVNLPLFTVMMNEANRATSILQEANHGAAPSAGGAGATVHG